MTQSLHCSHTTSLTLRGSIFGPVSSCNRNLNCDVAVVVVTPASFSFQVSCRFRISWQNAEALAIRIWKDSPCRSSGYKGIQKKDVKRCKKRHVGTHPYECKTRRCWPSIASFETMQPRCHPWGGRCYKCEVCPSETSPKFTNSRQALRTYFTPFHNFSMAIGDGLVREVLCLGHAASEQTQSFHLCSNRNLGRAYFHWRSPSSKHIANRSTKAWKGIMNSNKVKTSSKQKHHYLIVSIDIHCRSNLIQQRLNSIKKQITVIRQQQHIKKRMQMAWTTPQKQKMMMNLKKLKHTVNKIKARRLPEDTWRPSQINSVECQEEMSESSETQHNSHT